MKTKTTGIKKPAIDGNQELASTRIQGT